MLKRRTSPGRKKPGIICRSFSIDSKIDISLGKKKGNSSGCDMTDGRTIDNKARSR